MLSQTAEYALRAVLYLAEEGGGEPLPVQTVADALSMPRNYLSKTLHMLSRAGVVLSSRGPSGGFKLALPAAELPLVKVIAPFDDLGQGERCLLGRPECGGANPCAAHEEWKKVADRVRWFFQRTTVADLQKQRVSSEGTASGEPARDEAGS